MAREETEERRKRILSKLAELVSFFERINDEMGDLPHRNGVASRSLKPKSGMYITHVKGDREGINVGYEKDGKLYEINIFRGH